LHNQTIKLSSELHRSQKPSKLDLEEILLKEAEDGYSSKTAKKTQILRWRKNARKGFEEFRQGGGWRGFDVW
jgi:hypothetical protein